MKTRTCTCRNYEFNGTCEHLTPVPVENWEKEFREYFDKTLKTKKPTIKNLDRELLVDFIRKLLIKEREEARQDALNETVEKYGHFKNLETGQTLRFFLLPHTQHLPGDDGSLSPHLIKR